MIKHKISKKKSIQLKNKTRKRKSTNTNVFTNADYNSGDGMLVSVWGPSLWNSLHIISFNYPVHPTIKDKKHYRDFILNLEYVLPCKFCRQNLHTNFKQLPLTMEKMKNRETFSRYIYDLHELINKMLNKKSNLSYKDVRERYEHFRSRCTEEKPKLFTFKQLDKNKNNKTLKNKENKENKENKKNKEKGCTEPLYGKKSKCIIKIVPQDTKEATFQMDKKCIKTRE
jgi:hypothetical protein